MITATFRGTDSLGYRKGKTYLLEIFPTDKMTIRRLDGTGVCTYQSLLSFLKNWNNIQIHPLNNKL